MKFIARPQIAINESRTRSVRNDTLIFISCYSFKLAKVTKVNTLKVTFAIAVVQANRTAYLKQVEMWT
jgi:hypothetical protein